MRYFFEDDSKRPTNRMESSDSSLDHKTCEFNVLKAMETNPCVQLLLHAMARNGCPINLRRHISCEPCKGTLKGGFDSKNNQLFVCENSRLSYGEVGRVLTHELIHAFDHCTRDVDWSNPRHLACSEIRAANLTDCSPMRAFLRHFPPSFRSLKAGHRECVADKALRSVSAVRRDDRKEYLKKIVEDEFQSCYEDVRPFRRRRPPFREEDCRESLLGFKND